MNKKRHLFGFLASMIISVSMNPVVLADSASAFKPKDKLGGIINGKPHGLINNQAQAINGLSEVHHLTMQVNASDIIKT